MTPEIVRAIAKREAVEQIELSKNIGTVDTTDATATVLMTFDTESNQNGRIRYTVSGLKDDGATGLIIERIFRFVNDGTTLTVGTETSILIDNALTGATVAANVNGTTVEIKVTGIAATNISWVGQVDSFTQIGTGALL